MTADRKTKISALIVELVATFIQQEANPEPMITITSVDLSPDFKNAIVFFTTIPDHREADALAFLKRHGTAIRNHLKDKARIKRIPHLDFMVDAGERHRQHMDELVREIKRSNKD